MKTIDVTLKGPAGKPFVQAPKKCRVSWPFAITIANFDGPNITARDKAACSSGTKKKQHRPARRGTKRGDGDADDR